MSVNGFKVNGNTERYDYRYLDNTPDFEGAIAEDYNSTKPYNVGDYVWHNGVLYSCISDITTPESWTAAHWTAAELGNDVGGLKSALCDKIESAIVTQTIVNQNIASAVANVEDRYTISIYGTATAVRRYCCYNGQDSVKISGSNFEKTLDAGVYEITFSSSGAVDSPIIDYTYTTFNSSVVLTEGIYVFSNPVMIGVRTVATNYGTSERPTTITFHAKRITALDAIARAEITEINGKLGDFFDLSANVPVIPVAVTDYNDLTTPGVYKVTTSTSGPSTHRPFSMAHKLLVLATSDSSHLMQIAFANTGENIIAVRRYNGEAWVDWGTIVFQNNIDSFLSTKYDINATTIAPSESNPVDYDTLTAGTYVCPTSATAQSEYLSHCPVSVGHRLFVMQTYNNDNVVQVIMANRDFYYRYAGESWKHIATSEEAATAPDLKYDVHSSTIPNGSDYDDDAFAVPGTYICASMASAKTMSHCPVSVGHRLFVMQTYNNDNVVQVIMANRDFYYRYAGESWKHIATVEDIEKNIAAIPDYYKEHIVNKETIINDNIANAGLYGDSFAIVADTHWERDAKNSPALIKHIAANTPVNRLMMLGDYYITQSTEAGAYKALNTCLGAFKDRGMRLYIIPGNHDYNKGTVAGYPVLTEAQVYGQIMTGQNDVVRSDDSCTFYFDNTQLKIRYYFTSCMYDSSYNVSSYKWIFRNMEDIPEGYKVIVFTHTGLSGSGARNHNYAQYLTGALKALRDKTTYTFDNEEFDYSNTDGLPIAIFSGHHHIDYVFSDNGIACIQVTTDAYYYEDSSSYDDPEIPVINREMGTDSEQAFDVATVETNSNTIYLTRIGAGRNRIVHCNKTTVSTTTTLTSELAGSLTWGSTDANVATVSNGTVRKVGNGSCMISAADISGNVEYWNIVA